MKSLEDLDKGFFSKFKQKEWIDNASYEELLRKWRFAEIGDPFFTGEIGQYYAKKMDTKRNEVGNEEHVRISKKIGWQIK